MMRPARSPAWNRNLSRMHNVAFWRVNCNEIARQLTLRALRL
jgi:hypothetical protein